MVKTFKMIVICALGSMALFSCMKEQGTRMYIQVYSVIRSDGTGMYFSSDDGIDLYPAGGFNSAWGNVGDRIVVGFYYNPYTISETTTRMDITIEDLIGVQTFSSALSAAADTVGSGAFTFKNSGDKHAILAWTAQNYLTATFYVKYSDATKHTFGFGEESTLFRNDTLFLSLWHNANEDGQAYTSQSHIALELSDYGYYLSARDSTVILLNYKAENVYSSNVENYSYPVIYKRSDNESGY
jgi:hypothetical protein